MRKASLPILLLALSGVLLTAAVEPTAETGVNNTVLSQIPQRIQHFIDGQTVAGAVTLVAHGNDVIEFDALGKSDIEAGRPMQKDTIFQIMSMTKPVTAIGIMMLAEEGKLALRDPIEQYLPEFRNQRVATNVGPDAAHLSVPEHPVTIRDLLTHTAGIPDPAPAAIHDYPQLMNVPLADVVRQLAKEPLLFQPGTQWSYSSPGIEILGRLIEVCSGQKYEDFITDRILHPLGMKDSFFFPPADKVARIAMVYVQKNGKLVRAPATILGGDPARHRQGAVFPAPGWGLYSTAEDLLHLYHMMLNNGVYEGHRYLSFFSVHLMTESQTNGIHPVGWMGGSGYGLAWEIVTTPFGELAGHLKGTYGHGGAFGTQGWIDPQDGLISIMLIQRADGGTDSMRNVFLNMAESSLGK
ncbi:MAG TPA: serine hydrolase domain-containing protein [Bryobacteraceae bacterium]|nr:serine hydrolase domain-containing protein [Bryobacteraceae bacterium]